MLFSEIAISFEASKILLTLSLASLTKTSLNTSTMTRASSRKSPGRELSGLAANRGEKKYYSSCLRTSSNHYSNPDTSFLLGSLNYWMQKSLRCVFPLPSRTDCNFTFLVRSSEHMHKTYGARPLINSQSGTCASLRLDTVFIWSAGTE